MAVGVQNERLGRQLTFHSHSSVVKVNRNTDAKLNMNKFDRRLGIGNVNQSNGVYTQFDRLAKHDHRNSMEGNHLEGIDRHTAAAQYVSPRVPEPDDDGDADSSVAEPIVSLQADESGDAVTENGERDDRFVVRSRALRHHLPPHHRAPITEHLHDAIGFSGPHGVPIARLAATRSLGAPQTSMFIRTARAGSRSSRLAGPPV